MVCLRNIKYLTKKKVLALQPIYYVGAGLKVQNKGGGWFVIKFEGDKLKKALDNFLLYETHRCFTTKPEAQDLVKKLTEQNNE